MRFDPSGGPFRFLVTAVLATFVSLTAAIAVVEKSTEGRLDSRVRTRAGGVIGIESRDIDELARRDPLREAWNEFRAGHGGQWKVYIDERSAMPALVSGRGVELVPAGDLSSLTLAKLESHVRSFLQDQRDLLGDWSGVLILDTDACGQMRDGHWQLVFRQNVDGVTVENSRLEFHVVQGRLTLFGASNWGPPTVSGLPEIDAAEARGLLDDYLELSTSKLEAGGEPQLTLMALDADPVSDSPRVWNGARGRGLTHALVWRISFHDPEGPELWVGEVDAHDGSIRAFYDGTHYAGIRGGVMPPLQEYGCGGDSCELQHFPMPFVDVTETGQTTTCADAFGNLTCVDPDARFETTLSGPYVQINDLCGTIRATQDCGESLDMGIKAGENCEVAPGASSGNTAAARAAYYHINRVAEIARFYNPGNTWLTQTLTTNTNVNSSCNAFWDNGEVHLYRAGGSCANFGELQGIIVHEWGHGYDENDGGGFDRTSEAYADVVSVLSSRDSCVAPGAYYDGRLCGGFGDPCLSCTGIREQDWAKREANTPATPMGFVMENCGAGGVSGGPCGRQAHCASHPIVESIYDLATRDLPAAGMDQDSAWQFVDRIWYSTRVGSGGPIYTCNEDSSDSCGASSWYQRMRVADDDDGDLSNGSPHAAELYAAFARHEIACGAPGDPENQSTSSCPVLAGPQLILAETGGSAELTWDPISGAAEYVVFRGEMGCSRQQVPVATATGGVTTYLDGIIDPDLPRSYRVEAVGANPACRSAVSNCVVTLEGPRLQLNDHEILELDPNTNGNGVAEPGETVAIPVTLANSGAADARDVLGRLRTLDPAQGRIIVPVVHYPDMAWAESFQSSAPHFELALFESGTSCGATVPLELEMFADGAPTETRRIDVQLGDRTRDYPMYLSWPLPPTTSSPRIFSVQVPDDLTIVDLDVSVDITHPRMEELIVELISPQETTVRLHDDSGSGPWTLTRYDVDKPVDGPGSLGDFAGESSAGSWKLAISDTVDSEIGSTQFESFTVHVTVDGAIDCEARICPDPTPAEIPNSLILDRLPEDVDGSVDLAFSWDAVTGAAGYHVLQTDLASFDDRIELTGRTTGGETNVTVEDGAGITPALTFFQVRAVNSCNEESP